MAEGRICDHCGAALKRHAGKWICPGCLLRGALSDEWESTSREGADSPVADSAFPRSCGDYELLELIARGGMGMVYRARQKSLNRIVAVKTLLGGQLAQPKFIERFRAEAQAVAQMQHPNIVAIHEVGAQDGQLFFSMDYVEGENLARISADFGGSRSAEFRRCAGWLKTIAEAIHYAHQRGIIHRDLKPSNVLIDPFDQPRITDFGLAKRLTSDSELTLTGQVMGSPNYLPPEQAAGQPVGVESDVYALGAILYHLLTGRPPFEAESVAAVLRQVIETEPLPPRLLNPGIPRDLETISLKCLEKEVERRYPSARELADDLGRFLEDKPILARPVGIAGKSWKWCRRRPALAGMGLALAVTFTSGLAGVLWQWRRASQHAQAEFQQRQRAEAGEYAADMLLAQKAVAEGNRGDATRLLELHRQKATSRVQNPIPGVAGAWEWRYLWQFCEGDELSTLYRYPQLVEVLILSPEGRWLAAATRDLVDLWDLTSKPPSPTRLEKAIPPLAFTSTGLLATCTRAAAGELGVAFWDVRTGRIVRELPGKFGMNPAALAPDRKLPLSRDGELLAILERQGLVRVVEIASGQVREIPFHQRRSAASVAAFSPDGKRLAIAEDYGRTRLCDLRTGVSTVVPSARPGALVSRITFSPGGDLLAVGYEGGYSNNVAICLWDVDTLKLRGESTSHTGFIDTIDFNSDGSRLISAATDWTVRIWNVTSQTEERCLLSRSAAAAVMLPDGKTLVSGADDGSICYCNALDAPRPPAQTNLVVSESTESFSELEPPEGTLEKAVRRDVSRLGVAFTRNSDRFITTDTNGFLVLGDTQSFRLLQTLPALGSNHWTAALSPDDRWLATGDAEGTVTVWDWTNQTPVTHFALPYGHYGSLRFSRSGHYLLASVLHYDWTASVRIWRTGDWREIPLTGRRFKAVWPVDLSMDDRILAAGYINGAVKLFRFPSLEDEVTLPKQTNIICGVLFSPDGRELVSVNRYGLLQLWDVETRRPKAEWSGDMRMILGSALSPDGRRLALGGFSPTGNALQLWDPAVRRETCGFRGERQDFVHLAFSPDGNVLAATGLSGIAQLWRAPSWTEIEAIEKAKAAPRQE